jgi:hypothetical protein
MGDLLEAAASAAPQGQQQSADSQQGSQSGSGSSQQNLSGQSGNDWRAQIPEDVRGEKLWEKYKDPGSAFKSLAHLEKKLGSAVNIPGEKATPEEIAAFREKLGVPKDVSGYKVDSVKLPGEYKWDDTNLGAFNKAAHDLGLTPAQHAGVLNYYSQALGQHEEGKVKDFTAGESALKEKWGTQWDQRIAEAGTAINTYDADGAVKQLLKDRGLANHPAVLEFLQRVGSELGEDKIVNGEKPKGMTKEDAEAKVKEIHQSSDHPLYNRKDPKHNDAVKEYAELLKAATV